MATIFDKVHILYEDENYVVVDKPSGLVVHPDGTNKGPFLTDWFVKNYPEALDVGEPLVLKTGEEVTRPGVVHRLDKETSGVMVLAKTQKAFLHLKRQFQERSVAKTYAVFVYGEMKKEGGVIDRPIGKSSKDFRMRSAQRGARGTVREAVTEYRVIKRGKELSFVEASPKTGRTHQIRVHFKAIHHPVVCDPLYAPNQDCLGFSRLALHSRSIRFKGVSGKEIAVESPLPPSFVAKVREIQ